MKSAISGSVPRNSHSRVVNELGRAIVGGIYGNGALLPGDTELAQRFEVSRTVLREAMKTLSAKGMVVPKAKIGTRVTAPTSWNLFDADVLNWHLENGVNPDFLQHLSEMRLSFEPFAARLAAERASEEKIATLYERVRAMEEANSMESFALADLDFHMALLDASKNPFMYSVGALIEAALATSFRLSSPFGDPERHRAICGAHRRIADAIAEHDADTAAEGMRGVILHGRDRILESGLDRE
ncbi:FadR/GntR family transcriptional regulator [Mesorhizobium sp. J18]|uniref:FadR/GntR family transcriptional regulator n=1 Tax=Mesorhizobium sp. J18 TaxID=935263 RepID=UPI0011AB261C|nr:FadR/GntR family transcriptional regulator [Mesorhizobium sp. J18]